MTWDQVRDGIIAHSAAHRADSPRVSDLRGDVLIRGQCAGGDVEQRLLDLDLEIRPA